LIRKLFEKVAQSGLNVDMISLINMDKSIALSFTIVDEKKKHLDATLKKTFRNLSGWEIEYQTGYIKISVVGIGMKTEIGVASDFFDAMKKIPIRMITTSEIKISCLVEQKYKQAAVNALTAKFKL
jgi:aspartate kinase